MSKEPPGAGPAGYALWAANNTIVLRRGDAVATDAASGPPGSLVRSRWAHVVAVYDGAAMTVYVDGVAGATVATTRSMPGNTAPFTVGRAAGSSTLSTYWKGLIDELSVFGRALRADEVAYLYGGGS